MLYRVEFYGEPGSAQEGEHLGYRYFGTKRAALRACRRDVGTSVDTRPTPGTKQQVLALLSAWAGHADNG